MNSMYSWSGSVRRAFIDVIRAFTPTPARA
jgi:hypothetical protein